MSDELITVDTFRIKKLLRDPEFYIAAAPLVALAFPGLADFLVEHKEAFIPMLMVLVGRFVVRTASVRELGRFAQAIPQAHPEVDVDVEALLRAMDDMEDEGIE